MKTKQGIFLTLSAIVMVFGGATVQTASAKTSAPNCDLSTPTQASVIVRSFNWQGPDNCSDSVTQAAQNQAMVNCQLAISQLVNADPAQARSYQCVNTDVSPKCDRNSDQSGIIELLKVAFPTTEEVMQEKCQAIAMCIQNATDAQDILSFQQTAEALKCR